MASVRSWARQKSRPPHELEGYNSESTFRGSGPLVVGNEEEDTIQKVWLCTTKVHLSQKFLLREFDKLKQAERSKEHIGGLRAYYEVE